MRHIAHLLFALLLAAAVAGIAALAATQLGGVSYLTVRGASMEPQLHAGDLAVIRRSGPYRVGDAVAYRSEQLQATLLHRIVEEEPDGFVLQGDNNDFTDPDRPAADDIVGKLWWRLPHAGRLLAAARQAHWSIWIAAGLAVAALPAARATRRRPLPTLPRPPARLAPWTSAALAAVAATAAGVAWAAPTLATGQADAAFSHSARVDYGAAANAPVAYPDGSVDTGDPVFLSLVPEVEARFAYQLDSSAPLDVEGTAALSAVLSNSEGLHRHIPLDDAPLTDGGADLRATIDIAALWAQVEEFRAATATGGSSALVTLHGQVEVHGTVGRGAIDERFEQDVDFDLDRTRMRLVGSDLGPGSSDLTAQRVGQASPSATADQGMTIAGRAVPLEAARAATTTAAAVAAIAAFGLHRRRRRGVVDDPLHGHRDRVVPVDRVATNGAAVADIADLADLAALAATLDRPILRVPEPGGPVVFVVAPDVIYRHRLSPPSGVVDVDYDPVSSLCDDPRTAAVGFLDAGVDIESGAWLQEFALDHLLIAPAGLLAIRSVDTDRVRGRDNLAAADGLQVQAHLAAAATRRLQAALVAAGADPSLRLVAGLIRWDDPAAETTTAQHGTIILNGHRATQWTRDLSRPLLTVAERQAVTAAVRCHIDNATRNPTDTAHRSAADIRDHPPRPASTPLPDIRTGDTSPHPPAMTATGNHRARR